MAGYEQSVWRVGGEGETLYLYAIAGAVPSDGDTLLGVMETPELAAYVVALHNGRQSPPPDMLEVR